MTFALIALMVGLPAPVPLLLETQAPKGFELQRFENALATYVTEAPLTIEPASAAITDSELCEQARDILERRHSSAALLARWQSGELRVAMLLPGMNCPKTQSAGIEVRAPFFYRVVALKIASLLREAHLVEQHDAPPAAAPITVAPEPQVASAAPVVAEPTAQSTAHADWLIGAGTSIRFSDIPVAPEVIVQYGTDLWRIGGRVVVGIPLERTNPNGMGNAELAGASASIRRAIIAGRRFGLASQLDVGAIVVWVHGKQTGGDDANRQYVVPELGATVLGTFAFNEHIGVEIGPALDVAARRLVITMGGDPLFESSWVTLCAIGRLTIRF